jgi:hypothetical protein
MAPESIKIRAMRQLGFICQIPVLGGAQPLTGIWMVLRGSAPGDTLFFGTRNFSATRDSLLVYYEGGTVTRTDDTWLRAKLTAVAPATCPNGSAGQKLTFNLPPLVAPQTNLAGNIIVGSPVWGFEYNVVYRSYQASDGKWYVGLRDSYGFQPVIGPLTGSGGLQFAYYDSTGSVTATPARVAMIRVRVAAQTAQPVFANTGTRRHQVDSVTTWIGLRNNLRRPLGT